MKNSSIQTIKKLNIRYDTLICLYLIIGILTAYWQIMSHEFVSFDDGGWTNENTVW